VTAVRVVAAAVIAGYAVAASATGPPVLPAGQIESVEIVAFDWGVRQEVPLVTSTDAAAIEVLAAVIRSGTPTAGHKCRDTGKLRFHLRDGMVVTLGILQGHQAGFVEYKVYVGEASEWFHVDESVLAAALERFGVAAPQLLAFRR
jgi:hypothetical protein